MRSEGAIRLKNMKTIEKERERGGKRDLQQFYRLVMIVFDYIVAHGV